MPDAARTPAEFVAVMRQLQRWSGLTLEELEARTANAPVLLPGGLAVMLGGGTLPRRELVSAFISACGCAPEVQADWLRAYERIATGASAAARPLEESAALEPPVPPTPERAQPEEQPRQHRPRHRKPPRKAPRGPSREPSKDGEPRGRRSLTPLVAAPAFVTAGIIAVAMVSGQSGDAGETKQRNHEGELSAVAPPSTGWYSIQPETAESVGHCLTILPDDRFKPTLSQDKCDTEDHQQRFRLEGRLDGSYLIKAYTNEDQLRCIMLDAPTDGARLYLSECEKKNGYQSFNLETAKRQGKPATDGGTSKPVPLFNLRSSETRQDGMCVGIDFSNSGTVQAAHTTCGKTAIWGYSFVPAAAVNGF